MQHLLRYGAEGGGGLRRRIAQVLLIVLFSFDLPPEVELGKNVQFRHNCLGTVIHPKTIIGDNVMICQGVTIGDAYVRPFPNARVQKSAMKAIVICDNANICTGAKVLCPEGVLTIGKGSTVGANAVLTKSTGENEIWAGIPARPLHQD